MTRFTPLGTVQRRVLAGVVARLGSPAPLWEHSMFLSHR
jgi:hypothetical protein